MQDLATVPSKCKDAVTKLQSDLMDFLYEESSAKIEDDVCCCPYCESLRRIENNRQFVDAYYKLITILAATPVNMSAPDFCCTEGEPLCFESVTESQIVAENTIQTTLNELHAAWTRDESLDKPLFSSVCIDIVLKSNELRKVNSNGTDEMTGKNAANEEIKIVFSDNKESEHAHQEITDSISNGDLRRRLAAFKIEKSRLVSKLDKQYKDSDNQAKGVHVSVDRVPNANLTRLGTLTTVCSEVVTKASPPRGRNARKAKIGWCWRKSCSTANACSRHRE